MKEENERLKAEPSSRGQVAGAAGVVGGMASDLGVTEMAPRLDYMESGYWISSRLECKIEAHRDR